MSTEQSNNDNTDFSQKINQWFTDRYGDAKLITRTLIVLVFIVNNIALSFIAFGFIKPNVQAAVILGSIGSLFGVAVLALFVNQGVKYQSNSKRKK